MVTLSVTPFAHDSFVLASLETPMSLADILSLLPSAPVWQVEAFEHSAGIPSSVKVLIADDLRARDLALLVSALEPFCDAITVSISTAALEPIV